MALGHEKEIILSDISYILSVFGEKTNIPDRVIICFILNKLQMCIIMEISIVCVQLNEYISIVCVQLNEYILYIQVYIVNYLFHSIF